MDQETRWITRYNEVKSFIETNKRNPSKYVAEERLMVHFLKRGGIMKRRCFAKKSQRVALLLNICCIFAPKLKIVLIAYA